MAAIWINEETYLEANHDVAIIGTVPTIYYLSEVTEPDYVESNLLLLQSFLVKQAVFPIYISFITYDDDVKDMRMKLDKYPLEYELIFLEEIRSYWTNGKTITYHPPCFLVKVIDFAALKYIMQETYYLAAQNEFYAISFNHHISFHTIERVSTNRGRNRKEKISIPTVKMKDDTTFLTIGHDGQGFYLFTNEKKYSSIEELCKWLPDGIEIEQINDTLIEKR